MNAGPLLDVVVKAVVGTLLFLAFTSRIPLLLLAVVVICLPCAWLYTKSRAKK
jgi:hypothetical protein